MTQEELYLLLMEQTLRNAKDHEARCRRRMEAAREDWCEAEDAVVVLAGEVEGFRHEMLKRRTS